MKKISQISLVTLSLLAISSQQVEAGLFDDFKEKIGLSKKQEVPTDDSEAGVAMQTLNGTTDETQAGRAANRRKKNSSYKRVHLHDSLATIKKKIRPLQSDDEIASSIIHPSMKRARYITWGLGGVAFVSLAGNAYQLWNGSSAPENDALDSNNSTADRLVTLTGDTIRASQPRLAQRSLSGSNPFICPRR